MIIDIHTHLLQHSWLPEKWWKHLADYYGKDTVFPSRKSGEEIVEGLCDSSGEKLLADMNRSGIDASVVLPLDFGLLLGEAKTSIEEQNLAICEIAGKSEGRIIAFVGIDPRRSNAAEFVDHCLQKGSRGIKLYPAAGFDVREKACEKIFSVAKKRDVPILIHVGHAFGPLLSKYGNPDFLDEICAFHPELNIVAAHLAGGWFEQLCWIGYGKKIYTDCALWQTRCQQNYREFAKVLRKALDMIGNDRVMFGSDWPFSKTVMDNEDFVAAIKKLKIFRQDDIQFVSHEIKNILGRNAQKLLRI